MCPSWGTFVNIINIVTAQHSEVRGAEYLLNLTHYLKDQKGGIHGEIIKSPDNGGDTKEI